ncbi:MAG TPA: dihydroneopterin aldolase [Fibrobacteria bacterium]|nr:dihydroneopterin aldolase [Fibrobacteria bacterium]HOX52525.1 dihydroneopterin aldolase [Fibrobacteria bacterium]
MLGTIELDSLAIPCIVGILPFERVEEQPVFVDLELDLDFGPAAGSESIEDTVDYAALAESIHELVKEAKFQLIETMAEEIAKFVLARHSMVETVRVRIHKPRAVPQAKDTRVRVERSR